MALFRTRFCGYAVEFSPFEGRRLAVATAQYFGVVGNGQVHVLDHSGPVPTEVYSATTQDGVYDVAWNEGNENQLIAACADGSVKLFDFAHPQPVMDWREHQGEIFGVHCNYLAKTTFATASYDRLVKVWDLNAPRSVTTLAEHSYIVYCAVWNPRK